VEELDLSYNRLREVPVWLSGLKTLLRFKMSGNLVKGEVLLENLCVESLDLSHNQI